jgi:Excreted virulence factor EspC, type VII ESX diderm
MNFNVNPAHLRTHGGAIEDTGTGAAGPLDAQHSRTTAGSAAAFGTDAASLAGLYQELTALTGEALDLVSGVMAHGGSELRQMAGTYERTDDGARDGFQRIQGELA